MEPTTTTATKSIDALHKKNAELVSNMHKIMNSDSGRITESVINTVGKRREKLVNENGRMKPEEIYGLVKAVSSMKKIKDGDIDAIAKEHGNLVDKMDAKTVKEFLAAQVGEGDDVGEAEDEDDRDVAVVTVLLENNSVLYLAHLDEIDNNDDDDSNY